MYSNDEIGVDIKWVLKNKDVSLTSDEDNLASSIFRRINTDIEETFYEDYGCDLEQYMGWKKNDITLGFVEATINDCLQQDPRIIDFETELSYVDGNIEVQINLYYGEDETLEFSLIIDNKDLIYEAQAEE